MTKHIDQANAYQRDLGGLYPGHPREQSTALRGILHALIALHEQGQPVTIKPTRATKETSK